MELNKLTYQSQLGLPEKKDYNNILDLYAKLFEDADLSFFKKRFENKAEIYSVLAYSDDRLIGFKIGYPIDDLVFYSWIGGVSPLFRQKGIATQLASLQENWAKQRGFKILKTKSMNRFKSMMILNLKNGYDITKIYTNTKGQTKIVFEKSIA